MSGPAKARCHLGHRPNPCLLSAGANAPSRPHSLPDSLNDLIALRVNTRQPILTRLLPYDLPRCPQPTGARVRSIPPCTFVPMPPVTIEAGEDAATCPPVAIPLAAPRRHSPPRP